ncbi:MAG: hypothetical protein ACRD32_08265 [Nitrososphaerales archaeon]
MLSKGSGGLLKIYMRELTAEINGERFDMNIGFSPDLTTSFNILHL